MIVEVGPIPNCSCYMSKAFKAIPVDALLLQGPNDAFDHAVLLRTVWRNELLLKAIAFDELSECEAGKTRPLSERRRKGLWSVPKDPLRAIRACSRGAPAVAAFHERESYQP